MKSLAMLTIPALSKALRLSSVLPPSSKNGHAAKMQGDVENHIAALIRLDKALNETEESSNALHAQGKKCWLDKI